jgi:hypothetical protein
MSTPNSADNPVIRMYQLAALGALLVVTVNLVDGRLGVWTLAPLLMGSLVLLTGWSSGALIVLGVTFLVVLCHRLGYSPDDLLWRMFLGHSRYSSRPPRPTLIGEVSLCAAVVTYVACHYRLVGLTGRLFPAEQRENNPWWGHAPARGTTPIRKEVEPWQRRPPARASSTELYGVLLAALACPVAATILWVLANRLRGPEVLSRSEERVVLLIWFMASILIGAYAVLSYMRQTQASPDEQRMYLQDQLWRETRRDQGRLNRWLVWRRLRAQKRKENS